MKKKALLLSETNKHSRHTRWAGISPTVLHQYSLLIMFEVHCYGLADAK